MITVFIVFYKYVSAIVSYLHKLGKTSEHPDRNDLRVSNELRLGHLFT